MGARTSRAGVVGALVVLAAVTCPTAEADQTCEALQIRTVGTRSELHRVVLPNFTDTRVGVLPHRMNALGYSAPQGRAYGIAEGFADGGHVMVLRPTDPPLDLGPVVAGRGDSPWNPIEHPTAGAIRGNRWYVVEDDYLHVVDVDPGSSTFGHVLSSVELEERHGPFSIDDVDVGPDGLLRGVAQTYSGIPAVVRLDQRTGVVEPVAWLPGLLPDSYGSAVTGDDGALYVTANRSGGVYRISGGGELVKLAEVPSTSSSDAAGCLRRTPPPEPPPPTPPPTSPPPPTTPPPTAPPPTAETPPSATPSAPAPTSTPPTTEPAPSATPVPPEPVEESSETSESSSPAPPSEEPDAEESGHSTQEKRRWALAALVLLIGGSAAARGLARR